MEIQDTLKVLIDIKGHTGKGFDYLPILLIVISGLISFGIAYFTSRWTRRNEIEKIRAEQENLIHKVDYDLKQMLIAIESDNYRVLYQKKLDALKKVKEIQFKLLETNSEEYDTISEYMQDFPFKELIRNMHDFIIDYSYIFKEEIIDILKDIYHDTEYTNNNYDPESSDWAGYSDRIFTRFHKLVELIINDLDLDFSNVEKKVK